MRTAIVIVIGLVTLAACIGLGPVLAPHVSRADAGFAFIAVWVVFSVVDWYVGVYRVGYPAMEELRIHAVILAIPVLAGAAILWKVR